jgi:hypothetical protein
MALKTIALGVAAGLAGRTARDAVDALSGAISGRAPRSAPQVAVAAILRRRDAIRRPAGLGPLLDVAASVVVGACLGGARAAGWRPGPVSGGLIATSAAF